VSDVSDEIDERIAQWVARQQIYFVATAPAGEEGLINCSPKGLDTLKILGPKAIAYLDMPGSGIETVAHLRENGRIVVMFCAFEGPPKIIRIHGRGRVVEPHDTEFENLLGEFPEQAAYRSIIVIDVERVSKTCGFGVPLYEHKAQRPSLPNWIESQSERELADYLEQNNSLSLDGLPGLDSLDAKA